MAQKLSLDTVGKCNNPACTAACGDFFAEGLAPGASLRGVQCTICGCFAAQHIQAEAMPSTTPAQAGVPAGSTQPNVPKTSATEDTLKGSRPNTTSFRDAANLRNANVESSRSTPGTFYPAKHSQVSADLNAKKPRNKMRAPEKTKSVSTATKAAQAASAKPRILKKYTVALVEGTKAVARRKYTKPNVSKLGDLSEKEYVRTVQLPADSTTEEIVAAVHQEFKHVSEVSEYGFRLLRVKMPMKKVRGGMVAKRGVAHKLVPMKGSKELNMETWQRSLANSSVRGGGRAHPSLVWIALNPTGPNLSLYGEECDADSLEEDLPSEIDDESGEDESRNSADDASDSAADFARTSTASGSKSHAANKNTDATSESLDEEPPLKKQKRAPASHGINKEDLNAPGDAKDKGKGKEKAGPSENDHQRSDDGSGDGNSDAQPEEKDEFQFADGQTSGDEDKGADEGMFKGSEKPGRAEAKTKGTTAPQQSKDKAPSPTSQSPFQFADDDDEYQSRAPVHAEHVQLKRLLKNLTKPKIAQYWWLDADKIPAKYRDLAILNILVPEWATMVVENLISVRKFYEYFHDRFLKPTRHLLELGNSLTEPLSEAVEAEFNSVFFLGPGGIDFLVEILGHIYSGIDRTYYLVQGDEVCIAIVTDLHRASHSLLSSLRHFKSKYPRSFYDPKGFRELCELLQDPRLPHGLPDNRMLNTLREIVDIHGTTQALQFGLAAAFGHATDHKSMLKDILIGGPHGLPYFYDRVICYALDELEHTEYQVIFDDLGACCGALARKVTSFIKSSGSSSRSHSHHDDSAQPEGRKTRSRAGAWKPNTNASRSFSAEDSDSDDDMPEIPNLRPKGDGQKRKKSPIIISDDSDGPGTPPPKRNKPKEPMFKDQPKPRPVHRGSPGYVQRSLQDLEEMKKTLSWSAFVLRVLTHFPHPDPTRRPVEHIIRALTPTMQFKRLSLIYHPDQNATQSVEWRQITNTIMQVLLSKRST